MTRVLTIVLLSGPISAGKSALARNLAQQYGAEYISTAALIAAVSSHLRRPGLQETGLRPEFQGGEWLVRAIDDRAAVSSGDTIIIDAVRTLEQVETCRRVLGASCRIAIRASACIYPYLIRVPNVDVLVGGQWGSEGKGNIAFALAQEYDLLVRVGAPNAGHKVRASDGSVYTHRQLPSGTRATNAPILLGPGAVLDVTVLLRK